MRIFDDPVEGTATSALLRRPALARAVREGLRLFHGDIEAFFTAAYYISTEPSWESMEHKLRGKLDEWEWMEATIDLAILIKEDDEAMRHPGNFLNILAGAVMEEITFCIGTTGPRPKACAGYQPVSEDHRLLAKTLAPGDAVISFNYDTVADYALLNEGLLSTESFRNPAFEYIQLPEGSAARGGCVHFYKPHGSFTWRLRHKSLNLGYAVVFGRCKRSDFGFFAPIIFPYYAKMEVLDRHPIFAAELACALVELAMCDRLVVIGKQFWKGDRDIAEKISAACAHKWRLVTYVDPQCVSNSRWLVFHNELFNAHPYVSPQRFATLEDYVWHLKQLIAAGHDPRDARF